MKFKKALCLLLAMMMVFALVFPVTIYADAETLDENGQSEPVPEEVQTPEGNLTEKQNELASSPEEGVQTPEGNLTENQNELASSPEEESSNEDDSVNEPLRSLAMPNTELLGTSGAAAVITDEPENTEPRIGSMVSFTVAADNAVKYQWQYSTDGENYTDIYLNGYKTPTLSFKLKDAYVNYTFRCEVTGEDGEVVYSKGATFEAAASGAVITANPTNTLCTIGSTVSFTVAAENAVKYQWQYSTDGENYTDIFLNGYKTPTLSFKLKDAYVNYTFRCAVTGEDNVVVYSQGATFVKSAIITANPTNAERQIGSIVSFTVAADNAVKYQWQYSTDGVNFSDISLNGYKTPTLSFKLKDAYVNYTFRCAVTGEDGEVVYSKGAAFEAAAQPAVITADPQDAKPVLGSTVSFTVAAQNAVKYQWQYSKDGGNTYSDIYLNGYKTATLSFKLKETYLSYTFRCEVTGEDGEVVYSKSAAFEVEPLPAVIKTNPEDVEPEIGSMVSFSVVAENAVKYQWQYSKDGGETYSNTLLNGYKTATLNFKLKEAYLNYSFRCAVTGSDGETVYSESAAFILQMEDENGVVYKAISDTTCRVESYTGNAADLVIEEYFRDRKVVEIGPSAFENNTTLVSIDLPDSIEVIGKRAFAGCINLSSMS